MTATRHTPRESEAVARRRPRSRAMIITTSIVAILMTAHMFLTAVVNTPFPDVKYGVLPGAAADAYTRPVLVQNYRIFAPNPASEDRELWVRSWIETPSGERVETAWVNATAVELSAVERRVLRKQMTIMAAERYMAAYRGLNDAQQEILTTQNFHREGDRARLADRLAAEGPAQGYLTASDYATAYATQVAHALHGDENEILAVQTRVLYSPVVRWSDRHDSDAEAPSTYGTRSGWREPLEYPGQSRDAFARTFLDWYEYVDVEAVPR